jgi:hypothetical protein
MQSKNWALTIPYTPDAENLNPQTGLYSKVPVSVQASKVLLPVPKRRPLSDVTSQYQVRIAATGRSMQGQMDLTRPLDVPLLTLPTRMAGVIVHTGVRATRTYIPGDAASCSMHVDLRSCVISVSFDMSQPLLRYMLCVGRDLFSTQDCYGHGAVGLA